MRATLSKLQRLYIRAFVRRFQMSDARLACIGIALVTVALARLAAADVLTLKNGTVIHGEVLSETPDGVLFKGKIAGIWGEVFFEQARVATLTKEPGDQGVEADRQGKERHPASGSPTQAPKPVSADPAAGKDAGDDGLEAAPAADTSIGDLVSKSDAVRMRVEPELLAIFDGWPLNVLECKVTDPVRAVDMKPGADSISLILKLDVFVETEKWKQWAKAAIERLEKLGLPSRQAAWTAKDFPRLAQGDHVEPQGIMSKYFPAVSAAVRKQPLYLLRGVVLSESKGTGARVMFPLDTPMLKSATEMWRKGISATQEVAGNRITLMIQRDAASDVRMYLLPPNIDPGLRVVTRGGMPKVAGAVGVQFTAEDSEGNTIDLGDAASLPFASLQERSALVVWPVPIWDDKLFSQVTRDRASLFGIELPQIDTRWLLCFPSFVIEAGEDGFALAASRATTYNIELEVPKDVAIRVKRIVPRLVTVGLRSNP